MDKQVKFTKETTLDKVLEYPQAEEVLKKYNLPCLWCPMAGLEMKDLTIGDICQGYGIDLKALVRDLNSLDIKKGNQKG